MTKAERYEKRVTTVLTEQNFIVGITEKKLIQKRTASGRRYFFMVAKRREGTDIVERFVKIPENNTKKLLEPFRRQIEVGEYLKNNNIINTRGVIASNHDAKKGIPFVVMETFAAHHSKIGFIEGDAGVSKLTGKEASSAIDQLLKLHAVSVRSLPLSLRKSLKKYTGEYSKFKSEIARYLAKKVVPLDAVGQTPEPFHLVLERRLQMPAVKTKVKALLDNLERIITLRSNKATTLMHGDTAPNNLYIFDSGEVELLDLEWVGTNQNSALAMVTDFGNLRARAWNNKKFRNALDSALLKVYIDAGRREVGDAIMRLGILRSHLLLAGFFENYSPEKQKEPKQSRRRKETEQDLLQVFHKAQ